MLYYVYAVLFCSCFFVTGLHSDAVNGTRRDQWLLVAGWKLSLMYVVGKFGGGDDCFCTLKVALILQRL